MMDDTKSNIKLWLDDCLLHTKSEDDCLLHTKSEDDLLATLNFVFKKCQTYRLNPHASKGMLLAIMMRYCGRWIITDGMRFDPKKMDALQAISAVKQM
jgi:hypothetical protein